LKQYVWVGGIFMFFFGGAYFGVLYYLLIYFQSVYNTSPIGSGVRMLALIIPLTLAAIVQGIALSKIGIVPLFWIMGSVLGAIGSGLFYTMNQYTSTGRWIGYQVIVGFTSGWTFQVALSNAQVHATPEDMSQVSAIINCKCDKELLAFCADTVRSLRDSGWCFLPFSSSISIQQPAYPHSSSHSPRRRR